jgi:hypothetical protein
MKNRRLDADRLLDESAGLPEEGIAGTARVRRSAIAVAMSGVVLLSAATPYTDLVLKGTLLAHSHIPIGPIVILFVLLALNPILSRLSATTGFRRSELVFIYCLTVLVAGIPSFGVTHELLPMMTAAPYYDTIADRYMETFGKHLPDWLFVNDVEAATSFYEGLNPGESIPWRPWIVPLLGWSAIILLVFSTWFSALTLVRGAWVDRERLAFPLAQIPLVMTATDDQQVGFLRRRSSWIGMAIPAFLYSLMSINLYYPAFPSISTSLADLNSVFAAPPYTVLRPMGLDVLLAVVGVSFLLPKEISFSVWFFYLAMKGQFLLGAILGYGNSAADYPFGIGTDINFHSAQGYGALMAIVLFGVWRARTHLRDTFVSAITGRPTPSGESPALYRVAWIGLIAGFAGSLAWSQAAGMSLGFSVTVLGLFFLSAIGIARIVSEAGLFFFQLGVVPQNWIWLAGGQMAGAANVTMHGMFHHVMIFDPKTFMSPQIIGNMKLASETRQSQLRLLAWSLAAIAVSLFVAYIAELTVAYTYGGRNLAPWFYKNFPVGTLQEISTLLTSEGKGAVGPYIFTGIGFVLTILFSALRMRYFWWPNPVGYVVFLDLYVIHRIWFSIFLGWICKALVLKFGGRELYDRARYFFVGLIVGQFVTAGLWLIVDLLLGIKNHAIHFN